MENTITGITLTKSADGKFLQGTILIPFDGDEGFSEESAGNKYFVPIKARGNEGKLGTTRQGSKDKPLQYPTDFPENYDTLPLIKDGKSDMYVWADGRLTTEPYTDLSRRQIKNGILRKEVQASSKRMYSQTIKDAALIWPDNKVRRIAVEIKANDPLTPEEFASKKTQATAKRQASTAQQIVTKESHLLVEPLIAKWRAAGKDNETIVTLLESMEFPVPDHLRA